MVEGKEVCPCKRISCPRHGDCASCREHHHISRRSGLTRCEMLDLIRQKYSQKEKMKEKKERLQ